MNKENLNSNNRIRDVNKDSKNAKNDKKQNNSQLSLKRFYSSYKKETVTTIGRAKYDSINTLIDSLYNKYKTKKKWKLEFCEYFEKERYIDFRSKDYFPKSSNPTGSFILTLEKFWILWLDIIKRELNFEELVTFINKAICFIEVPQPKEIVDLFNSIIFSLAIPDEDIVSYCKKVGKEFIENGPHDYLLNINFKTETITSKFKPLGMVNINTIIPEIISEDTGLNIKSPELCKILTVEDKSIRNRLDNIKIENFDNDILSLKYSIEKIKKSIQKFNDGEKLSLLSEDFNEPGAKTLNFNDSHINEKDEECNNEEYEQEPVIISSINTPLKVTTYYLKDLNHKLELNNKDEGEIKHDDNSSNTPSKVDTFRLNKDNSFKKEEIIGENYKKTNEADLEFEEMRKIERSISKNKRLSKRKTKSKK